jgi:hypothetical protein
MTKLKIHFLSIAIKIKSTCKKRYKEFKKKYFDLIMPFLNIRLTTLDIPMIVDSVENQINKKPINRELNQLRDAKLAKHFMSEQDFPEAKKLVGKIVSRGSNQGNNVYQGIYGGLYYHSRISGTVAYLKPGQRIDPN